jgi:hypothetical protein
LFRLCAGNPKAVERLRASFDRTGDADLESAGDVATVASLLKLWLRELPEPVIASHVATQLLDIQESKWPALQAYCQTQQNNLTITFMQCLSVTVRSASTK